MGSLGWDHLAGITWLESLGPGLPPVSVGETSQLVVAGPDCSQAFLQAAELSERWDMERVR